MHQRPRTTYTQRLLKIFIVTNAPEDDALAADLVAAIQKQAPHAVFFGVGGQHMQQAGVRLVANAALGADGAAVRRFFMELRHKKQLLMQVADKSADMVITVGQASGFGKLVLAIKKHLNIPCVHYGQVLSFKKDLHKKQGYGPASLKAYDAFMCFSSFEAKILSKHGLKEAFVGHPLVQPLLKGPLGQKHTFGKNRKIALLPGHERGHIHRLMPLFIQVVEQLKGVYPGVQVVIPLVGTKNPRYFEPYANLEAHFVRGEEANQALQACDAALGALGASNLNLAILGVPMVGVLKPSCFWAVGALKQQNKGFYHSPINMVLNQPCIPEVTADVPACTILEVLQPLLENTPGRAAQLKAYKQICAQFSRKGKQSAAAYAAELILSVTSRF